MKNLKILSHIRLHFLLFLSLGISTVLSAQTPDIKAIAYNNKISIQLKNNATVTSYFSPDISHNLTLDFYFAPDDPRNGSYTALASNQPSGQVIFPFGDIPFQPNDTLTFSVIDKPANANPREYIFIRGDLVTPPPPDAILDCPTSVSCYRKSILLSFNSNVGVLNSATVYFFAGDGSTMNGYGMGLPILDPPSFVIKHISRNGDCEKLLTGRFVVIINGRTCIFENGQLVNANTCSPWGEYYQGFESCAPYFENCIPEIIKMLSDKSSSLPCKQWVDNNFCSTFSGINRSGKVAIGTNNFSTSRLTVKNGIITDKAKVASNWGDYVFEKDYPLMPLETLESYIKQEHHLPETPSGREIENEGSFDLGEVTVNHQVKIEEIFLHLIALEQETDNLEFLLNYSTLRTRLNTK